MSYIHPSSPTRAKVSIHLQSRKPRPQKFNVEALLAMEKLALLRGVPSVPPGWNEQLETEGEAVLDVVVAFWKGLLAKEDSGVSAEVAEVLLKEIVDVAGQFPATSPYEGTVPAEAVIFTEARALKETLRVTSPAKPAVEW